MMSRLVMFARTVTSVLVIRSDGFEAERPANVFLVNF